MTIRTLAVAILVAVVANGCATTTDTNAEHKEQTKRIAAERKARNDALPAGDPAKIVCKRIVKTGTRFSEKVCATNEQWAISGGSGRKATDAIQRRTQYGKDAT